MPVVPDPGVPDLPVTGLVFSPLSVAVPVTLTWADCHWWLIIPERPELSIALELVVPTTGAGALPSGDVAWAGSRDVDEGVFHAFARRNAIVTHGDPHGEELDVAVVLKGEAAFDAFNAARESFLGALLQSDQVGRQWYVDLGAKAPYALPQLRNRPTAPTYVVTLHLIEVDAT